MTQSNEGQARNKDATGTLPATVKDPVCGMTVDPKTAANRQEHDGTTYYFCSSQCLNKFRSEPTKYKRS